jgi:transposase-like protein
MKQKDIVKQGDLVKKKVFTVKKPKLHRYSDEVRENAFNTWLRLGTYKGVAKELDITTATLAIWAKKDKWDEIKRQNGYVMKAMKPEVIKIGGMLGRGYEEGLEEREVTDLSKIAMLEEVCLAKLEGRESAVGGGEVWPEKFSDVLQGLKVAWEAKEKVLKRRGGDVKVGGNMNVQVNLVDMLKKASLDCDLD